MLQVEKRAKKTGKKLPADIRRFLKQTGLMETQYIRMLSSLSALSYQIPKLTVQLPSYLFTLPFCEFWPTVVFADVF